ncbi:hypothetical protein CLAFUW4_13528 [Fulvia fulva]|uniref:Uncharacterized protein n=1 Tax=Passalora fulva TaxID=5499 RepID=A0A9Q8UW48_PASFU|nr:uncharacterized protein CLAFUR5_13379 [Fulvia fulva]KAK4610324.1 hypothetical protein CLAFUR4_13530 [Fulvia fulva]KAK4610999.1 hypothetical protein CLAFUR0_13539 [Fulvia fulva]UJO24669.1 hypothetical protein CLAFUR5_13379 [Fulvia fulva]WPV22210.1 hypothetical protein CLAFUW4_13528 [Fulvia fulva]WPV37210.1 hypothetical protein CLAFUW7_13535 [Fulvia fulva]
MEKLDLERTLLKMALLNEELEANGKLEDYEESAVETDGEESEEEEVEFIVGGTESDAVDEEDYEEAEY